MKKVILIISILFGTFLGTRAQSLYYRLDVSTSNIYAFALSNLVTAGINALADDMVFDNSYSYTNYNISSSSDMKTKRYDVTGLTARDLFQDVCVGGKLGCQTFLPGNFNFGIYASGHYKINQFGIKQNDDLCRHNIQKALAGGGLMFIFGDIETRTKVIVELGLRYEMPLSYNGANRDKTKEFLNKGLSSNYTIRFGGTSMLQGLGIFADIPHYNQFKENVGPNLKMFRFGLVYTITPWRVKETH